MIYALVSALGTAGLIYFSATLVLFLILCLFSHYISHGATPARCTKADLLSDIARRRSASNAQRAGDRPKLFYIAEDPECGVVAHEKTAVTTTTTTKTTTTYFDKYSDVV